MITQDLKHGRVISHIDLSQEAIEAIDLYMQAGVEMHRRELAVIPLIPSGCSFQLYGLGNCVVVREPRSDGVEDDKS